MGRFNDQWVVDKTMMDYFSLGGGNCACCSLVAFNPGGLKGLINSISDLETDAADAEFDAAQRSPWPNDMRDQVWGDRVRLRLKMKKEIAKYRDFLANNGGIAAVDQFCREKLGPSGMGKMFQLPRSEILEHLHNHYGIQKHGALGVVLTSVIEQVANFKITKLPIDGRSPEEVEFEKVLSFDRRAGFILPIIIPDTSGNPVVNEDVYNVFLNMVVNLGGQKLLARRPKTSTKEGHEKNEDENSETDDDTTYPSFRADRRVIRLLIARHWVNQLISSFDAHNSSDAEPN